MNKKLLELLDKINAKKVDVKNFAESGELDKAQEAKDELIKLQQQFDILKDLEDTEPVTPQNRVPLTPKDEY